jgi:hypothetical protein
MRLFDFKESLGLKISIAIIVGLFLILVTGVLYRYAYTNNSDPILVKPTPTIITYESKVLSFEEGSLEGMKNFKVSVQLPSNASLTELDGNFEEYNMISRPEYKVNFNLQNRTFSLLLAKVLESFPNHFDNSHTLISPNFDELYRVQSFENQDYWRYSTHIETENSCIDGTTGNTLQTPCGELGIIKSTNQENLFFIDAVCLSNDIEELKLCDSVIKSVKEKI